MKEIYVNFNDLIICELLLIAMGYSIYQAAVNYDLGWMIFAPLFTIGAICMVVEVLKGVIVKKNKKGSPE